MPGRIRMTYPRPTTAAALVAILLASCSGVDRRDAGLTRDAPPVAVADDALSVSSPSPELKQGDEEQSVVVTGSRALESNLNRLPASHQAQTRAAASAPVTYAPAPPPRDRIAPLPYAYEGRDRFSAVDANPFRVVAEEPVSTFSIDVDTASYGWMRASLNRNVLPQPDSVRAEELINYFPYDYALPRSAEQPFSTRIDVFPSPWTEGRKLVRIGIRGYEVERAARPRANLVFLIDTSGSMSAPNKLGLVKQSLGMLVGQLGANDTVSIVAYAGGAGTVLEPTRASERGRILAAIERLGAGGSTAGAEGIRQAYALAERNFDAEGVNRVILATDGDFNVGITNPEELKGYVERQRAKGVFLSVLGFGMGN